MPTAKPYNLFNGDCLQLLPQLEDGSVDMILCDLPYAVTNPNSEAGQWDSLLPMKPMWEQFLRIAKQNAAIVLFSQGMFTAQLMMSQPKLWRYNLVWDKCRSSGFLNANRMPMRRHEDICVFYREMPTYNPQIVRCDDPSKRTHSRGNVLHKPTNRVYGSHADVRTSDLEHKYPDSILKFPRPHCTGNHPTEKSVDLCRWLIRSFTNVGEVILDATMGSGTTGVAAMLEDRRFVGIEMEPKYFQIAEARIEKALTTPRQEEFPL